MKDTLKSGIEFSHTFTIPHTKTVSHLYPEAEEFLVMPEVFATGYMIGLVEWACIQAINPHLDWPKEQTVGIHVDISHLAATPPGLDVITQVKLTKVDGRRLIFDVKSHDGVDLIAKGRHERFVINKEKFDQNIEKKIK